MLPEDNGGETGNRKRHNALEKRTGLSSGRERQSHTDNKRNRRSCANHDGSKTRPTEATDRKSATQHCREQQQPRDGKA